MASNFTFQNYTLDNHSVDTFSHDEYSLDEFTNKNFENPDYSNEVKIFNNTPAVEIPGRINAVADDLKSYLNQSINDDDIGIKGYVNKTVNGEDGIVPFINNFVNDESEGVIPYLNTLVNDPSDGMIKHVNTQIQSITDYINGFVNNPAAGFLPYFNNLINGPKGIVNYINGINSEVNTLKDDFMNSTKAYIAENNYGYTTVAVNRALLNDTFFISKKDDAGRMLDFTEGNKRTYDIVYNDADEMITYSVDYTIGDITTTASYEIKYDDDRNVVSIDETAYSEADKQA